MLNENDLQTQELAQKGFAEHYEDDGIAPWDIGRPKPPFIEIADQVIEPILDAGCGTGDNSIFFASKGLKVVGIDFVEKAIIKAKNKIKGRNLPVDFLVKDAVELKDWDMKFNTIIDSGLLHAIWNKEKYIEGLKHILNSGGRIYVFYFRDDMSWPHGISDNDLKGLFSESWEIESIKSFETNEKELGEWKMNFAVIRKT